MRGILVVLLFVRYASGASLICTESHPTGVRQAVEFSAHLQQNQCQQRFAALGCERFAGDPNLRDCSVEPSIFSKASSFAVGNLKCGFHSLVSPFIPPQNQSYHNAKYETYRLNFLARCHRDKACIENLFLAAHSRIARTDEVDKIQASSKISGQMEYLWNLALNRRPGTAKDSWLNEQSERLKKESGWKNMAAQDPTKWSDVQRILEEQYDKYPCLNDAARAEMACYVAMIVTTGGAALAQLSKLPKFISLSRIASKKPQTLQANQRMVEELGLRRVKSWNQRAPELAKEAVAKRVAELEAQIPSTVKRPSPNSGRIAETEARLAEHLLDSNEGVVRVEKSLDDIMNAQLVDSLTDPIKLRDHLVSDAKKHLTKEYGEFPQKDIAFLELAVETVVKDAMDDGFRKWEDLVARSRARAESEYLKIKEAIARGRTDAELKPTTAAVDDFDLYLEAKAHELARFKAGNPRRDEISDFKIWESIGKPEQNGMVNWFSIDRYKDVLDDLKKRGYSDHFAGRSKDEKFADQLVEAGIIAKDSVAYRERAFGSKPTAVRLPHNEGLKLGELATPAEVLSVCPNCPSRMKLGIDPHYDAHIWDRSGEVLRQNSVRSVAAESQKIANLPKGTSTKDVIGIENLKRVLTEVKDKLAGPSKEASFWSTETRNWFLEKLKDAKWSEVTPGNHPNHVLMTAEVANTKVRIALCVRAPCSTPHLKPGDIATIFPNCGPGVFKVAPISKIERALAAFAQPELSLNRDARAGATILEKLCK